jgi:hypothetical protein
MINARPSRVLLCVLLFGTSCHIEGSVAASSAAAAISGRGSDRHLPTPANRAMVSVSPDEDRRCVACHKLQLRRAGGTRESAVPGGWNTPTGVCVDRDGCRGQVSHGSEGPSSARLARTARRLQLQALEHF